MKFTDGHWLVREGTRIHHIVELRDAWIDGAAVTVHGSTRHASERGEDLGSPQLELRVSTPLPDIIHVQMTHHKGTRDRGPHFHLANAEAGAEIQESADSISLRSGKLSVRISRRQPWALEFEFDGRPLTRSGPGSAAFITCQDGVHMREQLDLGVGECVYGLGERFTAFVKNGQVVETWNRDGGTESEQAYKNIPFYVTNRGYGVLVNHPELVSFEVASERVTKVQFSVPGESLDYYVIGGPTLKHVLEHYTALSGRPALPPAWSFGLWLSTSFTTDYDEATVSSFVDGMAARRIPVHVFHFDPFWMKGYQWCDFEWDSDVFPEPRAMLARLKARDLHVCLWINPYISQRSRLFAEGMEQGFLLKKPNGDVWQTDLWQPGMAVVDFTNPAACAWYAGYLRRLVDMGVDCFKTDFGERIPTDVVYLDGSDPVKMHNYYAFLYNQTVFRMLEEARGAGHAVVFARAATVGSQQFPTHWGGDNTGKYESMAETLRGGLSFGLSGFGFWSHDIGGFEGTAPAGIYKRWVAFGMLSSHSRLHGSNSYRVPWNFDEEAVDVLRFFTQLKCRLMPYLYMLACDAQARGLPVMRAMVLEFFGDPACDYLDRQYMLGDSLLVSPVFADDGVVSFYLPAGTWTSFLTGERVEGGVWRQEQHDFLSLPLYVRPNTILPVGAVSDRPDYDFADGVDLQIFALDDGASAAITLRSRSGEATLQLEAERSGKSIRIRARGSDKPWTVTLRGVMEIASVSNAAHAVTGDGVRITPRPGADSLRIDL